MEPPTEDQTINKQVGRVDFLFQWAASVLQTPTPGQHPRWFLDSQLWEHLELSGRRGLSACSADACGLSERLRAGVRTSHTPQ